MTFEGLITYTEIQTVRSEPFGEINDLPLSLCIAFSLIKLLLIFNAETISSSWMNI